MVGHRSCIGRGTRLNTAAACAVEILEKRTLLSAVTWTAAGDGVNWTNPANWSTGKVPTAQDDVTISRNLILPIGEGQPTPIVIGSGIQSIHSLTTDIPITVNGAGLAVGTTATLAADLTLNAGALIGGTYTSQGGSLAITAGSLLDGVTLDTNTTVTDSAVLVRDGLTLGKGNTFSLDSVQLVSILDFEGTQTLGGSGDVVFDGSQAQQVNDILIAPQNGQAAVLTIAPGVTIRTGTASGQIGDANVLASVVNQGSILAPTPGASISILDSLQNLGTILGSNGGTINVNNTAGNFNFTGGTTAINGVTNANTIVIAGGTVTFTGTTPITIHSLTLSGGTLDGSQDVILDGTSTWTGGAMTGTGTITIAPGGVFNVASNTTLVSDRSFQNAGTVNLTAGTLQLNGGGNQAGAFNLTQGTTLAFGGTAADSFAAASSVTGGNVSFLASNKTTLSGTFNTDSTSIADSANVSFLSNATTQSLNVSGGNLNLGTTTTQSTGSLHVMNQSVFTGGTTEVLPLWVLDPGSALIFAGSGSPVIQLDDSDVVPGTLKLAGTLTDTATGTATITAHGSGANPGAVTLGGTQHSFTVNKGGNAIDLVLSADLTDGGTTAGSVRMAGSGHAQLSAASAFTGGATVSGGTLEITDPAALGTGAITFAGGTLAVRGAGSVTLVNPITVAASGTASFDVGTTALTVPGFATGSALNVTGTTGSLTISGNVPLQHDLVVNTSVPLAINGAIGGSFGLTKTGTASLTLGGSVANTYTGTTEVIAGTLILNKSAGVAVPGALRIDGPGTVQLQRADQIAPAATVTFDATAGAPTLDLNGSNQTLAALSSFQPGAGVIRLGIGTLTLNYGANPSPAAQIRAFIAAGSLTAGGTAVGYADGANGIVAGLAPGNLIVKATIPGDANLDGKVNFSDLLIVAQRYNTTGTGTWDHGDFNADAAVNFADLLVVAQHYSASTATAVSSAASVAGTTGTKHRPTTRHHVASKPHPTIRTGRRHG